MLRKLAIATFGLVAFLFVGPMSAEACKQCTPSKATCKCVTIAPADFTACGGAWYMSTSEDWRSPMFYNRKGCVCTRKSNTWSYIGAATNKAYVLNIWVGR